MCQTCSGVVPVAEIARTLRSGNYSPKALREMVRGASPKATQANIDAFLRDPSMSGTPGLDPSTANLPEWRLHPQFGSSVAIKAQAGDKAATLKNMQNIVAITEEPFKKAYVDRYVAENGREPTPKQVNDAYYDQLMKGFTNARYSSFGGLAGINEENLHPAFTTPKVTALYNSFPDIYVGPDGVGYSVPHMLSGIQWYTTDADGVTAVQKYTLGTGVNSQLAENLLKDESSREKGNGGIYASESKRLQAAFKIDPVYGMQTFLDKPGEYAAQGRTQPSLNPFRGWGLIGNEAVKAIKGIQ